MTLEQHGGWGADSWTVKTPRGTSDPLKPTTNSLLLTGTLTDHTVYTHVARLMYYTLYPNSTIS